VVGSNKSFTGESTGTKGLFLTDTAVISSVRLRAEFTTSNKYWQDRIDRGSKPPTNSILDEQKPQNPGSRDHPNRIEPLFFEKKNTKLLGNRENKSGENGLHVGTRGNKQI